MGPQHLYPNAHHHHHVRQTNYQSPCSISSCKISLLAQVQDRKQNYIRVSHVMPNSCNTICTRQWGDELLPCCYGNPSYAENTMLWFEKWWFVIFHFGNHSSLEEEEREGGRERWKRGKRLTGKEGAKESRLRYSEEEKKREEKGGRTRQGFTRSNLQQCFRQFGSLLTLYFYKASRNTSSAIHFNSIPTPARPFAFCQFYLSLSFLRMPLHFLNDNTLAISTLTWNGPEHNTACIQRRRNGEPFSPI